MLTSDDTLGLITKAPTSFLPLRVNTETLTFLFDCRNIFNDFKLVPIVSSKQHRNRFKFCLISYTGTGSPGGGSVNYKAARPLDLRSLISSCLTCFDFNFFNIKTQLS